MSPSPRRKFTEIRRVAHPPIRPLLAGVPSPRRSNAMRKHPPTPLILTCAALLLCSCTRSPLTLHPEQASSQQEGSPMTSSGTSFTLTSTAFLNGGKIPKKYTCDDAEQSPQLTWTGTPAQTQSLALIADDPDAPSGPWTHWLVWNIPANPATLTAATPRIR